MAISKDFVVKNGIQVGSTANIVGATTLANTLSVTGNATFSNVATFQSNVVISGNLTVSGTTTYVNTTTLNIADNIITLNADVAGATAPTENGGIEINRGSSANVQLRWNETTDSWEQSNAGLSVYYKLLANADVIDSVVSTSITSVAAANSVKTAYDYTTTQASTAYSNAVTYASNATNLTTGTLNTARLPAQVNVSSNVNVGANVTVTTTQYGITGTATIPTMSLNTAALVIGNSSVTGAPTINLANSVGNTTVNTTSIGTSWGLTANALGVYHSGVVNATTLSSGATFTANGSLVNAAAINVIGQINTGSLYAITSTVGKYGVYGFSNSSAAVYGTSNTGEGVHAYSNTGTGVSAYSNTSFGVYAQSNFGQPLVAGNSSVQFIVINSSGNMVAAYNVNAANFVTTGTVNTATVFATGQINATSHTVGTAFTANATLVNAAAINIVNQVNTATLYATTSANVGTALTVNSTALAVTPNATFDSGVLFVDAVNNRVGINTTAPVQAFEIVTGTTGIASFADIAGNGRLWLAGNAVGSYVFNRDNSSLIFGTSNTNRLSIDGVGVLTHAAGANATFDSGTLFVDAVNNRVGINNTTPGVALTVTGAANVSGAMNVGTNMGISGTLGVTGVTSLSTNLAVNSTTLFVDAVNSRVGIRDSTPANALTINGVTDTTGAIYISKTAADSGVTAGIELHSSGTAYFTRSAASLMIFNRLVDDGTLVTFRQDGTSQGVIRVTGTECVYESFCGAHWSQLSDNSRPNILRGTVIETIDEMCEWENEENDQLTKFKISDTVASKSVYGVFLTWDNDDDVNNDASIASLGAYIIRIAAGVTVSKGDLLESAGNGCARVQSDDIIRSSTIGKVTNGSHVIETYEDGSYLVPCVLYCG